MGLTAKISRDLRRGCLTVGDLTKALLQHKASDLVFFCTDTDPKLLAVNTVDEYCEHELTVEQGSTWLKDVDHSDFADDIDTIVVLGNES